MESCLFVLSNNYFIFDNQYYHQLTGTAMGTKFALPYACLTMGYLEDTKLRPDMSTHFGFSFCDLITKMIVIFVSNEKKAEQQLNELTKWLTDCNYPLKIIQEGIHSAKLREPAHPLR